MTKSLTTQAAAALLATSLVASPLSFADEQSKPSINQDNNQYTEVKQGGVFFTSAVLGAVAGGPVGFIVGALGGAWLGEEIKQADQLDAVSQTLTETELKVATLQARVMSAEQNAEHYAQQALDHLQLDTLFKTDASELTLPAKQRMIRLVDFLTANPGITIRLDGYADPRGNSDYNLQLSTARVDAVANHLQSLGLPAERINRFSHGDQLSQANRGDVEAYALERLVRIQLTRDGEAEGIAQVSMTR